MDVSGDCRTIEHGFCEILLPSIKEEVKDHFMAEDYEQVHVKEEPDDSDLPPLIEVDVELIEGSYGCEEDCPPTSDCTDSARRTDERELERKEERSVEGKSMMSDAEDDDDGTRGSDATHHVGGEECIGSDSNSSNSSVEESRFSPDTLCKPKTGGPRSPPHKSRRAATKGGAVDVTDVKVRNVDDGALAMDKSIVRTLWSTDSGDGAQAKGRIRARPGDKPVKRRRARGDREKAAAKAARANTVINPFLCTFCPAKFRHNSALKSHMLMHTGEKPFPCSVCSGKFRSSSALKAHSLIHTGEKPFLCSMCPARFRQSSGLNQHIRTHTGEKPFSCKMCSVTFRHSSALKRHTLTHTGEKPFPCTVCSAKFRSSSGLKTHSLIHTGEKPYSCTVCPAKFRQVSGLNHHARTHTGEKQLSCTVC